MYRAFKRIQGFKLNRYDDRETKRLISEGEYSPVTPDPGYILDLGAHKGYATEYFARNFPKAKIHAYEAAPFLFRKTAKRLSKYANVQVFEEAIAGHDGVVAFGISTRDVSSSIYLPTTTNVPCISLRTAVSRLGSTNIVVKMDIEGAEFEALKDIPDEVVEIVGEVHPQKAGRSTDELRALLHGFKDVSIVDGKKSVFRAVR